MTTVCVSYYRWQRQGRHCAKVKVIFSLVWRKYLNINQYYGGFLRYGLIAIMNSAAVKLQDLKDIFTALGRDIGVEIRVQAKTFTAMHVSTYCLCSRLKIS